MDDYSTEPRLVFTPLSHKRYCALYSIEMGNYSVDVSFYSKHLRKDSTCLELACGTGRLTKHISSFVKEIEGMDISENMVSLARQKNPDISYFLGDMSSFSLGKKYDAVIIPYNSLNLLSHSKACSCLNCVHSHLRKNGILLLHLYTPTNSLTLSPGKTLFQFQMFDAPEDGKIIKESLRKYTTDEKVTLTERYRIRPTESTLPNEDLSHEIKLLGYTATKWKKLITKNNFLIQTSQGDTLGSPHEAGTSSSLFVYALKAN